jgi:hypothetical protein
VVDHPLEFANGLVADIQPRGADRQPVVKAEISGALLEREPEMRCGRAPILPLERLAGFRGVIDLGGRRRDGR